MTEKNNTNNTSKNRPDTFRIAAYGLGALIVLICGIIIVTIFIKESGEETSQELVSIEYEMIESEEVSENTSDITEEISEEITEEISEEIAEEITEEISEEITEEISEEISEEIAEEITEEISEEISENITDEIAGNWETIPAGTVIDSASIDFNHLSQYFVAYEISDEVYQYINGKSYQENPYVALDDLRYVKLLHYNFNHELQVGELIVAADLQEDYIGIFTELFAAEYEIQSMYLPDRYWTGDPTTTDSASIDVNNSSCFMYRPATGSSKLSKHSYGRAIDINPQQNPYVSYSSGSPVWSHENANDYIDRTTGLPHVITEEDVCYQIFTKYGFTWGGAWTNIKDYQHFQK